MLARTYEVEVAATPRLLQPEPSVASGMMRAHENSDPEMSKLPLVSVVDDSDSVRESLPDLLQSAGFAVQAFSSAEAFLRSTGPEVTNCLILDVGLPGMSGPDLQGELKRRGKAIPIVFITAQGDKSLHPRLVGEGAVACLFKPFSDTALLHAVDIAVGTKSA